MKYEWLDNTPDLLKHLEERWPNRLPQSFQCQEQIIEAIGRQQVIAYIAGSLKQKQK